MNADVPRRPDLWYIYTCYNHERERVAVPDNQVSLTALVTAYVRAYHARFDTPKIFDDSLAAKLLPKKTQQLLGEGLAASLRMYDPLRAATRPKPRTALRLVMRAMAGPPNVLSRSRYTEDTLLKAVGDGVRQYVILGAGLDTFAFRHGDLKEQLTVFEIDHPAMLAFKRQRLRALGWEQPANLHFVPADFTRDNLAKTLGRSAYDPRVKGLFSWLGVTPHLEQDKVLHTLRTIAGMAPSGTLIVFDYLDTDAFVPARTAARIKVMKALVQNSGEPVRSGFDPAGLGAALEKQGLRLLESLSPADIQNRFFQGIEAYYACEHVHFALAQVL